MKFLEKIRNFRDEGLRPLVCYIIGLKGYIRGESETQSTKSLTLA